MEKKILSLFQGRHPMPDEVTGAVLKFVKDPTDLKDITEQVHYSLKDCNELILYTTGLSVALVAVINYCEFNRIPLTVMHHDKVSNTYFPQEIYIPDPENNKNYGG